MEMSVDGSNFTRPSPNNIPFGWNQAGGCLVIIDDETVFYAGGQNNFKGPLTNDVHTRRERHDNARILYNELNKAEGEGFKFCKTLRTSFLECP